MSVARLGDPLPARLPSRRFLTRDEAEIAHQRTRRWKALDAMQLGDDGHGGYRVDAAIAAKPSHRLSIRVLLAQLLQLLLERPKPLLEALDHLQIVIEDRPIRPMLEA
jgi:hypothetical protein